jgi:prepilin-type N-terminal cleavage/methylation domain-containing protein
MKTSPASRSLPGQVRQAFSLVELMVVTVIVVILAGLVAGVVVKAIDASRTTTSLTTMEVIQSGLARQLQQLIDNAKKGGKSPEDIYTIIRQAFPKSFAEANSKTSFKLKMSNGDKSNPQTFDLTVFPYGPYKSAISSLGDIPTDLQESFLLRTILEKGPFSKIETDQLPKGAIGQLKNIPVILDAWGDPIKIEIKYSEEDNALKAKPAFMLSSPNTAKGGK